MFAVINHLRFKDAVTDETLSALRDAGLEVIAAGAVSEQVVKVDDRHLILLMMFANRDDAGRIARDVGGPFMTQHIVPLLASPTERSLGEVIQDARA